MAAPGWRGGARRRCGVGVNEAGAEWKPFHFAPSENERLTGCEIGSRTYERTGENRAERVTEPKARAASNPANYAVSAHQTIRGTVGAAGQRRAVAGNDDNLNSTLSMRGTATRRQGERASPEHWGGRCCGERSAGNGTPGGLGLLTRLRPLTPGWNCGDPTQCRKSTERRSFTTKARRHRVRIEQTLPRRFRGILSASVSPW